MATNLGAKNNFIIIGVVTLVAALVFVKIEKFWRADSAANGQTTEQATKNSDTTKIDDAVSTAVAEGSVVPTSNAAEPNESHVNSVTATYSEATKKLLNTYFEINKNKNDNDPRLDRDFRNLSKEAKIALQNTYGQLPKEDRNGRGILAMLLGRELKDAAEMQFFRDILSEPPCLSLSDCGRETPLAPANDIHENMGVDVSLAYPQMVALYWLDKYVEREHGWTNISAEMQAQIMAAINKAKTSSIAVVQKRALDLEQKLR